MLKRRKKATDDDAAELLNLTPKEYAEYVKCLASIEDSTPSIKKIMTSKCNAETKAKAIELFNVYTATVDVEKKMKYKTIIESMISPPNFVTPRLKYVKDDDDDSFIVDDDEDDEDEEYTPSESEFFDTLKEVLSNESPHFNDAILTPDDIAERERILGIINTSSSIESTLEQRILRLNAKDDVKCKLYSKLLSTKTMPSESAANTINQIETAVNLPYNNNFSFNVDVKNPQDIEKFITNVRVKLDSELYSMNDVKEQLIVALNDRLTCPETATTSIGLQGPPGVGKTAIVSAFASAIGVPFERISLGGLNDASIFKGSHKHWLGSEPGIILKILQRMKISNGIILLDEIDKLGERSKSVQYALLHITDYTSNHEFMDAYLSDFPHDISKVWFMYSMNDVSLIDPVLLDRLSIVKIEGYTTQEVKDVIKNYIFPKEISKTQLVPDDIVITSETLNFIVEKTLHEKNKGHGIRETQRFVKMIINRLNFLKSTRGTSVKMSFSIPGFDLPIVLTNGILEILAGGICSLKKKEVLSYFI